MSISLLLSNIGVLISLTLGLIALFRPQLIQTFVSVQAIGKEGQSEIRATYGGFFIGISLYAIATQSNDAFIVIGIGWVTASFIRFLSLFNDAFTQKNIGGVIFELLIGLLCLANLIT